MHNIEAPAQLAAGFYTVDVEGQRAETCRLHSHGYGVRFPNPSPGGVNLLCNPQSHHGTLNSEHSFHNQIIISEAAQTTLSSVHLPLSRE